MPPHPGPDKQTLDGHHRVPQGTRIVTLSGDRARTVERHTVSFTGIDPVNGTVQLIGTFTASIPVQSTLTSGFVDPIGFQIGATPAPPAPRPTAPSQPTIPPVPVAGVSIVSQGTTGQVLVRLPGKTAVRSVPKRGIVTGRDAAWMTSDRCDGTLTRVTRGRVTVRDGRWSVTVRAGKSYLIKARVFAARRSRP